MRQWVSLFVVRQSIEFHYVLELSPPAHTTHICDDHHYMRSIVCSCICNGTCARPLFAYIFIWSFALHNMCGIIIIRGGAVHKFIHDVLRRVCVCVIIIIIRVYNIDCSLSLIFTHVWIEFLLYTWIIINWTNYVIIICVVWYGGFIADAGFVRGIFFVFRFA